MNRDLELIITFVARRACTERPTDDIGSVVEQVWSEGYHLATRGSDHVWCRAIRECEDAGSGGYWYKRIVNRVRRELRTRSIAR